MWVLLVLLCCISLYYFALLARFDNTTVAMVKNAMIMPFLYLPTTLLLLVSVAGISIVLFLFNRLLFAAPGVYAWMLSIPLEKIFIHYQEDDNANVRIERR